MNISDISIEKFYLNENIITTQEIVNKYCDYSFNNFNEKILVVFIIIVILEIALFLTKYIKNKHYAKIVLKLNDIKNIISNLLICILAYIVIIKNHLRLEFIFYILFIIFLIFLFIEIFEKIKNYFHFLKR